MTNEEIILKMFLKQFPQYKEIKQHLSLNIYADILDTRNEEGSRVIAISDLPHTLDKLKIYDMPKEWSIKQ